MAAPKASDKAPAPPGKAAEAPAEPKRRDGWTRWILGWIVAPGVVVASIYGGGVFVGANHPDAAVVRAVLWIVDLF